MSERQVSGAVNQLALPDLDGKLLEDVSSLDGDCILRARQWLMNEANDDDHVEIWERDPFVVHQSEDAHTVPPD